MPVVSALRRRFGQRVKNIERSVEDLCGPAWKSARKINEVDAKPINALGVDACPPHAETFVHTEEAIAPAEDRRRPFSDRARRPLYRAAAP